LRRSQPQVRDRVREQESDAWQSSATSQAASRPYLAAISTRVSTTAASPKRASVVPNDSGPSLDRLGQHDAGGR
jgi:hypothetical protein